MAKLEAGRKSSKYIIQCLVPDVCKVPPAATPVPFNISIELTDALKSSKDVNFKSEPAITIDFRSIKVVGNEAGELGGMVSGINVGACRPINFVPTVRVNKKNALYHNDTYCFMNCSGPDGPFNTIGKLYCLDEMAAGPAADPEDPMSGDPAIALTPDEAASLGGGSSLISKIANTPGMGVNLAKMAYGVSQNGLSPEAVLGGLGSIAGVAGFGNLAKAANLGLQAKQLANTDWSNPAAALAALGGVAGLGGVVSGSPQLARMAKGLGNLSIGVGASQSFKSNPGAMMVGTNAISATRFAAVATPEHGQRMKELANQSSIFRKKSLDAKTLQTAQKNSSNDSLSKQFQMLLGPRE